MGNTSIGKREIIIEKRDIRPTDLFTHRSELAVRVFQERYRRVVLENFPLTQHQHSVVESHRVQPLWGMFELQSDTMVTPLFLEKTRNRNIHV